MTVSSFNYLKDLTTFQHPMPVHHSRTFLMKMRSGEILKIILSSQRSAQAINDICKESGYYVLRHFKTTNKQAFWIEKK